MKFLVLLLLLVTGAHASDALYSTGHSFSVFGLFELKAADVQRLLPGGLELAPQTLTKPGFHPVMIGLGQQHDVTPFVFGRPIPNAVANPYDEAAIFVPFVKTKNGKGAYTYVPVLYLNDARAVLAGVAYGYNKKLAKTEVTPGKYVVTKGHAFGDLLSATYDGRAYKEELPSRAPERALIRQLLSQKLLGQTLGRSICSTFNWNLDTAKIGPTQLDLYIGPDFLPGKLGAFSERRAGVDETRWGAFWIESKWRLSAPGKCD